MSELRKKPGVAFWATVAMVVALAGHARNRRARTATFGFLCDTRSREEAPDWSGKFPINQDLSE